jgi:DNA-binding PadR family transcriptional regulator
MKPALVVQLRKEGTTRQARKKFKVTSEGKRAVARMLAKKDE